MNNPVYIAFDNEDSSLGHFFQSCHDRIREVSVSNGRDYMALPSILLSKDVINQNTGNADEYVFSAFSHGTPSTLKCGKIPYIECDDNVKNFYNSVFYTFACFTAIGIGKEFEESYVIGYFGYKDEAWVVPAYEDEFVDCATSGLVSFLRGKTLKESEHDLFEAYDKCLKQARLNPIYSFLLKNKQALFTIINIEDKTIDT